MFFIQAAEFKGCYFLTLYSPSRWGSVIGQRTIWLQQTPPPPLPSHSLQMYSAPGSLLPTVHKIRKCIIWIKAGHLKLPIASSHSQSEFTVFVLHRPRSGHLHFGKSGSTHVIPARSNRRTQYNCCWKLLLCLWDSCAIVHFSTLPTCANVHIKD